ncbi:integrase [Rhizobium azooxidifex]|uniref:Integrase n=1 Tax=Mycoplana azooxidifex TaxID=1636188 RepID=A0A7W6DB42_9HYPH|nr:site-specific integrase [Mycoplana azooxidifex]MBB3977397.1 integrase [Mycoplana azooxidifex]
MSEWRITRLRGKLALTFERDGKRQRHSLGTDDPRQAYLIAPALFAELTRPTGRTVQDLWTAYIQDKAGKAVLVTMEYTWKALKERFGARDGESITKEDCRAHTIARHQSGISDGTIHTELGHLRTVLVWAEKNRLIDKAPQIERPAKPDPKDRYLTREEAQRILASAKTPHLRTAIHLMLGTAARVTAILELKWDRVDFDRKLIHLRDPDDKVKRKGRAIVPINSTLLTALRDAQAGALTDYVVEWGGEPVKSLKRGIATAAREAKIKDVSAHVFRHTAAVWMAEAGVPMEEISQYLGHSSAEITRRVYARYSPDHLRKAADALNLGLYVAPSQNGKARRG